MSGGNEFVPEQYRGREQAYVKHKILETYLQRLFFIIGRKEPTINYVDCFAGPWEDESDDLKSTSIGISIRYIKSCQRTLQERDNTSVRFRALYIEKNRKAYDRLSKYIKTQATDTVELKALHGDYSTLIPEILAWCGVHFTFFFVDPKGWKQIGPNTISSLLTRDRSEFLINMMYEFANRAATMSGLGETFTSVFGQLEDLTDKTPEYREHAIASSYRNNLNALYNGRHAMVKVERPGKERTLYFLIYLSRHPKGIVVFKEAAESMGIAQLQAHMSAKHFKQASARSHTDDLFGEIPIQLQNPKLKTFNKEIARQYLLSQLRSGPILIDLDRWATFLQETDCYPQDFQKAMLELVNEGLTKNLTGDISTRVKKPIKPSWSNNAEFWALADQSADLTQLHSKT